MTDAPKPDAEVNGGIVTDVLPREEKGVYAIMGRWSGGVWGLDSQPILTTVYRSRELKGTVEWVGIAMRPKSGNDSVLLVRSPSIAPAMGDIFVFGEGRFASFDLSISESGIQEGLVTTPEPPLRGIAVRTDGDSVTVYLFSDALAPASATKGLRIHQKGHEYLLPLAILEKKQRQIDEIEIHFNSEASKIPNIVGALSGGRQFVLMAGQEVSMRVPANDKGRLLGETYRLFEPTCYAKAGSSRFFLRAARPAEPSLFISSDAPLVLLDEIVRAAAQGDRNKVADYVREQSFSPDRILKKLIEVVAAVVNDGGGYLRADSATTNTTLDARALATLNGSLEQLEARTVRRSGKMYALESKRRWFRFLVETEDTHEDWTIRYSDEWSEKIKGQVPRAVDVEFETQAKQGAHRGSGVLMAFNDGRSSIPGDEI